MDLLKTKIDQKYQVIEKLGSGMSGQVYLVEDDKGEKALKFLNQVQMNLSRDEALENFKNEFRILKELNHPHIAHITDFGYDESVRKYFFTSELINGLELHEACEDQPVEVIEKMFIQILRALNYLHSRGIYHFDIKPQNILVEMKDAEPVMAKLIDFGLSGFTSPKKKVGTPAYMAPEVIQGGVLDGRTDIYSLGVSFYKILTGVNPFKDKDVKVMLKRHLELKPEAPSKLNSEIPEYWDHILLRMLEKDPVDRYSQASIAIRDIGYLSGKKIDLETEDTKLSYLPEKGSLIGRDQEWKSFTDLFQNSFLDDGKNLEGNEILIVQGSRGTGKTRLLNEMKYHSQLRNVSVRTMSQFGECEQFPEMFLLLIDDPKIKISDVYHIQQSFHKKRCLIVFATESLEDVRHCEIIELKNYTEPQLKQYLESVTGLADAPDELMTEVYARTQGNPLFVTEFVKSLLSQGLLFDSVGRWDATTFRDIKIDFDRIHIPESVEEILLNRYRVLSAEYKSVLACLAVHGKSLRKKQIQSVLKSKATIERMRDLIEMEFIEEVMDDELFFKNRLYIEIIQKQLGPGEKVLFHDKLARIITRKQSLEDHLRHVSYGSHEEESREALFELGTVFLKSYQANDAIQAFQRLLEDKEFSDSPESFSAYFKLSESYIIARNYTAAIYHLRLIQKRVAQNSNFAGGTEGAFSVYAKLIDASIKKSAVEDFEESLDEAEEWCWNALDFIQEWQAPFWTQLVIRNYLAFIKMKRGDVDGAEKDFLNNFQAWKTDLDTDDDRLKVLNNRLADVYQIKNDFEKAVQFCGEMISFLENKEQDVALASAYYMIGVLYFRKLSVVDEKGKQEALDKSFDNYEKCEALAKRINNYEYLNCSLNGLGNLYYHMKDYEKALQYYTRALHVSRKSGNLESAGFISFNIHQLYNLVHNEKDSYSYLVYAIHIFEELKKLSPHSQLVLFWSYMEYCSYYAKQKELKKAENYLALMEKMYAQYEHLHSRRYWMEMRRGIVAYLKGDKKAWREKKEICEALVENDDQKEDLKAVLAWEIFVEKKSRKSMGALSHQSSTVGVQSYHNVKKIFQIQNCLFDVASQESLMKMWVEFFQQVFSTQKGIFLKKRDDDSFSVKPLLKFTKKDQPIIDMNVIRKSYEESHISVDKAKDGDQTLQIPLVYQGHHYGMFYFVVSKDIVIDENFAQVCAEQMAWNLFAFERVHQKKKSKDDQLEKTL